MSTRKERLASVETMIDLPPRSHYFPCLSIRQPWADLILHGGKDVENRSWSTRFRGDFLIHAGAQFDPVGRGWFGRFGQDIEHKCLLHRSAIVGIATVVDCLDPGESTSIWAARGSYTFRLANALALDAPYPLKGRLGFFKVDLREHARLDELIERCQERRGVAW